MLAGHETTAVTLFWSLTCWRRIREQQERVAEEVRGLAIEPETAMAALPRLVRTRAVVSEALRLYPPAFTIVREAIGPDRLGDFDLPKRSVVMIAPWVLHRHRQALARSGRVRSVALHAGPRIKSGSGASAPAVPRFAYLPFGAGPRVCVGAQFALTEAVLVLAMLLQRFELTLEDARPVLPVAIVTTQPDHPAKVRLRAR